MTSRMRGVGQSVRTALWFVVLVTGLAAQGNPAFVRTPDGSRFLLVPYDGLPVIHWVTATPAGELVDPPEYPGLSYAIARSTLSGTDTVGTRNWQDECKALAQQAELMRTVNEFLGRQEMPDEALLRKVTTATARLERIREPHAWETALRRAPAIDFEIREGEDAVLLGLTTSIEGFDEVARLLMDRRENSVLRDVQQRYLEVSAEVEARVRTPRQRVRDEVFDLAFFGGRGKLDRTSGVASLELARDVFRKMHAPTASYHVLVGGFDVAQMTNFLQRQFKLTRCPRWIPPKRDPRRASRERVSMIEDGERRGIAVAFQPTSNVESHELTILGHWFAGGQDSFLARRFAAEGILGVECHATAPFPRAANPGLLLVEVFVSANPDLATDADLLEPMRRAITATRGAIRKNEVETASTRATYERDFERSDPKRFAYWLAHECGIRGRAHDRALDQAPLGMTPDRMQDLVDSVLERGARTIVKLERSPR